MKKRIANFLRRLAHRIDPLPKPEPVTPLEFIDTETLAIEIVSRNDVVFMVYGQIRGPECPISCRWRHPGFIGAESFQEFIRGALEARRYQQ